MLLSDRRVVLQSKDQGNHGTPTTTFGVSPKKRRMSRHRREDLSEGSGPDLAEETGPGEILETCGQGSADPWFDLPLRQLVMESREVVLSLIKRDAQHHFIVKTAVTVQLIVKVFTTGQPATISIQLPYRFVKLQIHVNNGNWL
ncbi:hypothetical protein IFM58399_06652 [Aspergillus lentulus]|uniref:Uncharacterized protein n=1 Tax=Aspergillus lentulus TaxID=293939 RepID=A0ABQ1A692_ASPLE|nr:uncharacterized protein IFM58399_06652 [Aspergillus lentulus]GFF42568.1 hypothetical protein IFM58399_06652 [Aspergillus lentulus]GFF74424.1 hypothetical protein IFM60648_04190 [Aspergillus lentulus]GFG12596.1 hypothetical protein IFM61392_07493 [Aspergillus lentulus]